MLLAIVYANVALSQEWGFGPKAGLNISTFTNTPASYKAGIQAGFTGEYRMRNIAVEADILYTKLRNEADFLMIPLKAKVYLVKGLNIFVGPQLDVYVTSEEGKTDRGRVYGSIVGGVGYKFNKGFVISGSYNHGFKSVSMFTKSYISGFNITFGWDILQSVRKSK